jgi:hypothetical protein
MENLLCQDLVLLLILDGLQKARRFGLLVAQFVV